MTPEEWAHWELRARQARRAQWRENAIVLLVAIPLLLALNAAWIIVALVTGHWWFAF